MTTRIIDAEVIIKEKKLPIVNTEILIHIDWDINIKKEEDTAQIELNFIEVYGTIEWNTIKEGYKQKTSIYFRTDEHWKIETIDLIPFTIYPSYAKIDFDKKEIKIQLV
jgi:hypothetical protein